jgi:hypothetical protein
MDPAQGAAVERLVDGLIARGWNLTAHHGDCVGGDAEFHAIAMARGIPVIVHPPIDDTLRAGCIGWTAIRSPLGHLMRNRAIVTECASLIAAPYELTHQSRGGTWYTFDYAIKNKRDVVLVLRGGVIEHPNGGL